MRRISESRVAPTGQSEEVLAAGISVRSLVEVLSRPHVAAILWAATLFHWVLLIAQLPNRTTRFDFSVFYASAVAMRRGLNPYLVDLRQIGNPLHLEIWPLIHTTSTPTFLLCFMPFAYMPERLGYWIWFSITMAALAAALVLMLDSRESGLPTPLKWVVAAAIILYSPLSDHVAFAQAQILILLMLVLVLRWLASGRDIAAGIMLALAVMLRAFPLALALYLMITRRWRALFSMTVGLAAIGAVTVAGVGTEIVRTFVAGAAGTMSHHPVSLPIDVALGAFVTRLFWYAFGPVLSSGLGTLRIAAVFGLELALVGLSVRATLRTEGGRDGALRAYGMWVVLCVMLSPIAWIHYMVLFVIPFIQITNAAYRGRCDRNAMWAVVASYFLISISIGLRDPARKLGGDALYYFLGEGAFISVLLAYIGAYRFALDDLPADPPAVSIGEHPGTAGAATGASEAPG
jgi:Glycosyltransferase family 87